ncbi:MAG: hypothetical protein RH859_13070 [Longimicrobiales bacterium]
MSLPRREAAIYLTPLREGGSLPAVVEDTGGDLWVVKFRGAGQGPKALVAEVVVAGLARSLGLPVPELAVVELDATFGQGDRDPEILDILRGSHGVNVGLAYLDGAFNLDPVAVPEAVTADFATKLVWLDALTLNPDRSARNPNLMFWSGGPWLIDHGAALFDHHDWSRVTPERARRAFGLISNHVLLDHADDIGAADDELAARLDRATLEAVLDDVPDALLAEPARLGGPAGGPDADDGASVDPAAHAARMRRRYVDYLHTRLEAPRVWADAAEEARKIRAASPPVPLKARR